MLRRHFCFVPMFDLYLCLLCSHFCCEPMFVLYLCLLCSHFCCVPMFVLYLCLLCGHFCCVPSCSCPYCSHFCCVPMFVLYQCLLCSHFCCVPLFVLYLCLLLPFRICICMVALSAGLFVWQHAWQHGKTRKGGGHLSATFLQAMQVLALAIALRFGPLGSGAREGSTNSPCGTDQDVERATDTTKLHHVGKLDI